MGLYDFFSSLTRAEEGLRDNIRRRNKNRSRYRRQELIEDVFDKDISGQHSLDFAKHLKAEMEQEKAYAERAEQLLREKYKSTASMYGSTRPQKTYDDLFPNEKKNRK